MVSVTRQGGPQPTVVCWSKGSSEKGRHLEPKAPSFHFLEVLAGVKSHGSGWWGAHESREAQAGGSPRAGAAQSPLLAFGVPSCPAHTMLLVARTWRGLSPILSTRAPLELLCLGTGSSPGPGTLSLLTWLTVGPR